jgi:uncharacterized protein (UPF0335 family)
MSENQKSDDSEETRARLALANNVAQVLELTKQVAENQEKQGEKISAIHIEFRERTSRLERAVFGSMPPEDFDRSSAPDPEEVQIINLNGSASHAPPKDPPAAPAILKRLSKLEKEAQTIVKQNEDVGRKAFGTGAKSAVVRAVRAAPTKDVIKIMTLLVAIMSAYGACRHGSAPPPPAFTQSK